MKLTKKDLKRFWLDVKRGKPKECWQWTGYRDKDGYGQYSIKQKRPKPHRVSWIIHFGQLPPFSPFTKSAVLHRCDNPSCVNPAHLFLGTALDNMQDCKKKGRNCRGENNIKAKLDPKKIQSIRALSKTGSSNREIAVIFNVVPSQIWRIVTRRQWKEVN